MLEAMRDEHLVAKFGGRFKLTAVIQKRWRDLMFGARPLVEPEGLTLLEIAVQELVEGKVSTAFADDRTEKTE